MTLRSVAELHQALLAGPVAVTAQAVLVLIHRRREHGYAVEGTDSLHAGLRNANCGRSSESRDLVGTVSVVAVHASSVTVVDKHARLGCVVVVVSRRQGVPGLGELGHYIGRGRRN